MCITEYSRVVSANASVGSQPVGAEGIDHFDGDAVTSGQSQPDDKTDKDMKQQVGSKEKTGFHGKESEKGCDRATVPAEEQITPTPAVQSEDKFERSSRGDSERQHRTRRKEAAGSWADETEDRPEDDQKTYPSEVDVRRRDEGRGAAQYSRQDRRKSFHFICCRVFAELFTFF